MEIKMKKNVKVTVNQSLINDLEKIHGISENEFMSDINNMIKHNKDVDDNTKIVININNDLDGKLGENS
jgi:hypothetical protein